MRIRQAAALAVALLLVASRSAADDQVIVQQDKAFSQDQIVIQAGDRLVFSNRDGVSHNLFSRSPGFEFEVKVQLPGQDTPVGFERAGVAEVRCAIHPEMKLRVVVTEKRGGKP